MYFVLKSLKMNVNFLYFTEKPTDNKTRTFNLCFLIH